MHILPTDYALTELHLHVGAAVDPAVMWSLAHSQGIRLPTRDYWGFCDLISVGKGRVKTFEEYLALFHWTELIQSGPSGMERSVYEIIGQTYRQDRVTLIELRFNPMKRNRGGERDLDHIIAAAGRGLERAMLEYPVSAGLILCLDKGFSYELNEIIARKAAAHRRHGVIGIDIAGPDTPGFYFSDYERLFAEMKDTGLGLTVHAGETGTVEEMREAIVKLRPHRIGHGIRAAADPATVDLLLRHEVVLEICPTSNLHTGVVNGLGHLEEILRTFDAAGVRFCIGTDGPHMLQTSLRGELHLLLERGILDAEGVHRANQTATLSSFIRLSSS